MIIIEKPSLDDDDKFPGNPILRGLLQTDCLSELRVDLAYQREELGPKVRAPIMRALLEHQPLPEIQLGMRGDTWSFAGENVRLHDPVYIIDGQQRIATIRHFLERFPTEPVRLGATVHFSTTMEWEKERFHALNYLQKKVSTTLLLANMRDRNYAIATLFGLTKTRSGFPLCDRVAWGQSLRAQDVMSGLLFARVTFLVHYQLPRGAAHIELMSSNSLKLVEKITLQVFRENVTKFWEWLDHAFPFRDAKRGAPWFKTSFLFALAMVIADHLEFWSDDKLTPPPELARKLRALNPYDADVYRLCGGGYAAINMLYLLIVKCLNRGRQKKLTERPNEIPKTGGVRRGPASVPHAAMPPNT